MNFQFVVEVNVERTEGKFESRDSIETALIEELEGADPGTVEGDNGGTYEVQDWSVEVAPDSGPRAKKTKDLGDGSVDSRPLGKIPEFKALASAWYHLTLNPDSEQNIDAFEYTMEKAFQMITSTME